MGRARDVWGMLGAALAKQDTEEVGELYALDSVYLEPQNPPHEGHLLIKAYVNSWLQARTDVSATTKRLLESADGATLAVEWSLSYSAGGRLWKNLPRASWLEVDEDGIRYHRDYY